MSRFCARQAKGAVNVLLSAQSANAVVEEMLVVVELPGQLYDRREKVRTRSDYSNRKESIPLISGAQYARTLL